MKSITIPILFHTKESEQAESLGIPYTTAEAKERHITFYQIVAVSSYFDEKDNEYGRIYANGDEFITKIKEPELTKLIARAFN